VRGRKITVYVTLYSIKCLLMKRRCALKASNIQPAAICSVRNLDPGLLLDLDQEILTGSGSDTLNMLSTVPVLIRKSTVCFSNKHFHYRYLRFSANHVNNFRIFGNHYLKHRFFELFSMSGGFFLPLVGSGTGSGFFRGRIRIRPK
jgi:hypothetical protein